MKHKPCFWTIRDWGEKCNEKSCIHANIHRLTWETCPYGKQYPHYAEWKRGEELEREENDE